MSEATHSIVRIPLSDGKMLLYRPIFRGGPAAWELATAEEETIRLLTTFESDFVNSSLAVTKKRTTDSSGNLHSS